MKRDREIATIRKRLSEIQLRQHLLAAGMRLEHAPGGAYRVYFHNQILLDRDAIGQPLTLRQVEHELRKILR
jgi:hypothetical protein